MSDDRDIDQSILQLLRLQKHEPRVIPISQPTHEYVSKGLSYSINSHGFRGPEFKTGLEILFAGCSHTFGSGLPVEATWPYMVAAEAKTENYGVMAKPGFSIQRIVSDIYSFTKEYGNPKVILCNFPDLYRHTFITPRPYEALTIISKEHSKGISPIPDHYSVFLNISAISSLETFCKNAGIKLIWTFWGIGPGLYEDWFTLGNSAFSDYAEYYFDSYYPDNEVVKFCIQENKMRFSPSAKVLVDDKEAPNDCCPKIYEQFPDCYHLAHDRYEVPKKFQAYEIQANLSKGELDGLRRKTIRLGWSPAHPGAHRQWHWAKFFLERM
jgi:hypothetical protein